MNKQNQNVVALPFLAGPALCVAALLIVLPLVDVLVGMGSIDPSVVRWRYGAVGLIAGSMLLPTLGCLLAVAAAYLLQRRWLQVTVAACIAFAALLMLVALGSFLLDAAQLRGDVRPQLRRTFDLVTVKSIVAQVAIMITLVVLSIASFRAGRATARRERQRTNEASPLLVTSAAR